MPHDNSPSHHTQVKIHYTSISCMLYSHPRVYSPAILYTWVVHSYDFYSIALKVYSLYFMSVNVSVGCIDGDVRLVDGYIHGNGKEGRVQICLNNTWGSLCSDSWDDMDAVVACRQLGFPSANSKKHIIIV